MKRFSNGENFFPKCQRNGSVKEGVIQVISNDRKLLISSRSQSQMSPQMWADDHDSYVVNGLLVW
jgi:hypothetical protein